ncbi:MAG: hypothetical protein M1833_000340 [Piccolia ochrophora]|nr:MAG: hypothetical protein M1833_000340 [Piccolia ochrophora]
MSRGDDNDNAPKTTTASEASLSAPKEGMERENAELSAGELPLVHDAQPKSSPVSLSAVTDRVLNFLSNASNETLGGFFAVLGLATYLFLGRLGLVVIGVIAGIVLHATWENSAGELDSEAKAKELQRRKQMGLDIVYRLLLERDHSSKHDVDQDETRGSLARNTPLDYSGFAPETQEALNSFTAAIIRDYVHWWYTPILPSDESFPLASRRLLTDFILSVSTHLSRKRPADTFLNFLTNACSIMIVFLSELSSALSNSSPSFDTPMNAIQEYLEATPQSSLANVLDKDQQQRKLKMVANDILNSFLDPKLHCEPARIFLREILAGVVLEMTVQSCSKPEWINEWIIYLLEEGEPELINAIDAGMAANTSPDSNGLGKPFSNGNVRSDAVVEENPEALRQNKKHQKRVSKAEEAMEEAMLEAQRLNRMIAEEDARRDSTKSEDSKAARQSLTPEFPRPLSNSSTEGFEKPETKPPSEVDGNSISDEQAESKTNSAFTSFDQLVPQYAPTALQLDSMFPLAPVEKVAMTLHNASITIFDDSAPNEKGTIRSKPVADILVQIEPVSSAYPGWMIVRKYADFETLHEVLRRISVVSGVARFTEQHAHLPSWKGQSKASFRADLERYLSEALSYQQLAESVGMKRFLEKEGGHERVSPVTNSKGGFPGLGWPNPAAFETMGKGMMDVLASAPKGAAGGGKALIGGVSGVFSGVGSKGQKRSSIDIRSVGSRKTPSISSNSLVNNDSTVSIPSKDQVGGDSHDSPSRPSLSRDWSAQGTPQQDRQSVDHGSIRKDASRPTRKSSSSTVSSQDRSGPQYSQLDSALATSQSSLTSADELSLHLPPPPSDIPDNYGTISANGAVRVSQNGPDPNALSKTEAPTNDPERKSPSPLSEEETRVAVELFFAVINELYTLSSAWNIRRTLLNAAKTYLLRPGNPNLESIRALLQDSVISTNTSDAGVAQHIRTLEKNTLPTEAELKAWPPPPTDEEKEALRVKARKLLVERGMPQALTSVMGNAASAEALGKVFDCLQVDEVARGLMFGLVLQGVRAVTQ